MLDFEWDEAKSEFTRRARGFGFDLAARVFAGPTLQFRDRRLDYGEARTLAIGAVEGIVLAVVYTDRDGRRRIISARRANRGERRLWHERFA